MPHSFDVVPLARFHLNCTFRPVHPAPVRRVGVLVIHRHRLYADAVARHLDGASGIRIAGIASTGVAASASDRGARPWRGCARHGPDRCIELRAGGALVGSRATHFGRCDPPLGRPCGSDQSFALGSERRDDHGQPNHRSRERSDCARTPRMLGTQSSRRGTRAGDAAVAPTPESLRREAGRPDGERTRDPRPYGRGARSCSYRYRSRNIDKYCANARAKPARQARRPFDARSGERDASSCQWPPAG